MCVKNAQFSLQKDIRRMNEHRVSAHQAPIISLEELQGFETCEANKSGPKKSYKQVTVTIGMPIDVDFRSESVLEHRVGLLKWDSLFKDGEGVALPEKSMFHCVDDGVNPYFEEVVAYLGLAQQACRKKGCELLRQQAMRDETGKVTPKSFHVIQEESARHYATNIASVVFFAKNCAWDSTSQVLTSARTIMHSLLFEPRVSISQTYMLRYASMMSKPNNIECHAKMSRICHIWDMSHDETCAFVYNFDMSYINHV